jgi:hypothetical protein
LEFALGGFVSLKKADTFLDPVQRKLLGYTVVFIVIAVIDNISLLAIDGVPAGTIAFTLLITLIVYTLKRSSVKRKIEVMDIIVSNEYVKIIMSQFNVVSFTIAATSFILILYSFIVEINLLSDQRRNYKEAYGIEFVCPLIVITLLITLFISFKLKAMTSKVKIYFLIAISILIELIAHSMIKLITMH